MEPWVALVAEREACVPSMGIITLLITCFRKRWKNFKTRWGLCKRKRHGTPVHCAVHSYPFGNWKHFSKCTDSESKLPILVCSKFPLHQGRRPRKNSKKDAGTALGQWYGSTVGILIAFVQHVFACSWSSNHMYRHLLTLVCWHQRYDSNGRQLRNPGRPPSSNLQNWAILRTLRKNAELPRSKVPEIRITKVVSLLFPSSMSLLLLKVVSFFKSGQESLDLFVRENTKLLRQKVTWALDCAVHCSSWKKTWSVFGWYFLTVFSDPGSKEEKEEEEAAPTHPRQRMQAACHMSPCLVGLLINNNLHA